MVDAQTSLIDVKPVGNAPTLSTVRALVQQVDKARDACRIAWWNVVRTVCLDNQKVARDDDVVRVSPTGSGTIVPQPGSYNAIEGVEASVRWDDGSISRFRIEA